MAVSTIGALIASAFISAGSAAYSVDQQNSAAAKARRRKESAATAAQAEADRIAAETKPEEEALTEARFGIDDENIINGATREFIIPKTSKLGTSSSGRSGLGFKV